MLKEELFRAFRGRRFWLACVFGLLACYIGMGFYFEGKAIPGLPFERNPYEAFLQTIAGPSGVIALLAPLVVVLPFADSYALDKDSGYLKFVLLRTGDTQQYYNAKFAANAVAGGTALFIPLAATFAYLWYTFPHGLSQAAKTNPLGGLLGGVFPTAPALYISFLMLLAFIFGVVYASLGLALSSSITNRYVVLATPFLLYNIGNLVLAILGLTNWTPPTTLVPHTVSTTSWITVFIPLLAIFAGSRRAWNSLSKKEVIL